MVARSIAGLQRGFPFPTQWLDTAQNSATSTSSAASVQPWLAPIPAFTVACTMRLNVDLLRTTILGNYTGVLDPDDDRFRIRFLSPTQADILVQASGGVFTWSPAIPDILGSVVNLVVRWEAGASTDIYVDAFTDTTSGGTGTLQVPSLSRPFYIGGSTAYNFASQIDANVSNVCAWFGTALTAAECALVATGAVDPRALSPDHSWLLDGDYLDTVGGMDLTPEIGPGFEAIP